MLEHTRDDPGVPEVIAWGIAQLHDKDYATNSSRGGFSMRMLQPVRGPAVWDSRRWHQGQIDE
jgi:hypothetical protein